MIETSDPVLASYIMTVFSGTQFITGVGLGVVLGILFMSRRSKREEEDVSSDNEEDSEDEGGDDNPNSDVKLILVVRNDLKMGKGKIAAQCSHAAVQAYEKARATKPNTLRTWERNGQPKIVVKCESEEEMLQLARRCKEMHLIASLIKDAGRTQILPGSRTVLGVGPGSARDVNEVTGHLKLL